MRPIFKFIILFFCLWAGTKSLLEIRHTEQTMIEMIIDMVIFIIFIGSPAMSYWNHQIDKAFNDDENDVNNEEENNNN